MPTPTDLAFSAYLLEKALVALVPGSAFGTEGYVRISFATSMANLEKAMTRMHAAITEPVRASALARLALPRHGRRCRGGREPGNRQLDR